MNDPAMQTWSIIILCYNEEYTIVQVIKDAIDTLSIISRNKGQVVVVNDGSSDKSEEAIKPLLEQYNNITYIRHDTNLGIGEALHSGYDNSCEENVVMVSGDAQFDVKELIPYKNFPLGTFVSFYRIDNEVYGTKRKLISSFNRIFNRYLLGLKLKDVNFIKAYKLETIKALSLKVRSSLVESEICAKQNILGHKVIEVESTYKPQIGGQSYGASKKIINQAILDMPKLFFACLVFRFQKTFGHFT